MNPNFRIKCVISRNNLKRSDKVKLSERSTGVILLGILAVAGLGLSGYMFLKNEIIFPSATVVRNVWYVEKFDSSYDPADSYEDIPSMSILATVNTGESLYMLFNAHAGAYGSGAPSTIEIRVKMNGILLDRPYTYIGVTGGTTDTYSTICLQYSNRTVPAGIYNISICARRTASSTNWINDRTLLVYTYV